MMKVASLLLAILWLLLTSASAQEKKHEPQTIATESKELVSEVLLAGRRLAVHGEAVFTVTEANSDDTLTGTLSYKLSADGRVMVALAAKKDLIDVPDVLRVEKVLAVFAKHTKCPGLTIEFEPQQLDAAEAKIHLTKFVLRFEESPQELSQLFCRWARNLTAGRGHTPVRVINSLLKGEKN